MDAGSGPSTRAVHAGDPPREAGGPVVNPIVRSATFFSHPPGSGPVLYQRYGNAPNHVHLERRLAALEGAEDAVVVASGMAATACALLSLLRAGDHVVATRDVYGGTRVLLEEEFSRLGIETTFVDLFAEGWTGALRENTRVVWAETPSNPLVRVTDLAAVAEAAHRHGAAVAVDCTFASPVNFRALVHGADVVVHSATKYLGGHSDLTAGVAAGSAARMAAVRERARTWGPTLDPQTAWLLERGLKTLAVRMERHNRNGREVAAWLEDQPAVARVHHPALESHPDHAVAARVLDGFGGMLGVELRGGGEAASRFVAALELASVAPSLGGVETLVSEPRFTSHAAMTPEGRAAMGIPDGFVRISVGIEDAADLMADFARGLRAAG